MERKQIRKTVLGALVMGTLALTAIPSGAARSGDPIKELSELLELQAEAGTLEADGIRDRISRLRQSDVPQGVSGFLVRRGCPTIALL